jgi:hypothetical protein
MIWINCLRFGSTQPRVAQPVITDEKHPTYSNREILTRKTCRKRVIADFLRRNANFEHSSNKPQFPLFESHIAPAFSRTNPEYFKRFCGRSPNQSTTPRLDPGPRRRDRKYGGTFYSKCPWRLPFDSNAA